MDQMSLDLKYGAEVSPARTFRLQELASAMGLMGRDLAYFSNFLNYLLSLFPQLSSSKTFRASYLPTGEQTSKSSFKVWPKSGILSDGACLIAAISESPNRAVESTLLDILEDQPVSPRYYLSPSAAMGSLRRAQAQGRHLFPPLKRAFEILAQEQSSSG